MTLAERALGRTGHRSSILAFGGAALWSLDQAAADAAVEDALKRWVNHFDVAPSYGEAEPRLAPSVERYRDRMFLACKTRERSKDRAWDELRRSLERLRTDHFDLYQCHAVSDTLDLGRILGAGGAIEAFEQARSSGLVRFLGITGHHCAVLKQAIERYPFDTVMFPLNPIQAADPRPAMDYRLLLQSAVERGMGIIAIKSIARSPWPAGSERPYSTWYRPFDDAEHIEARLRFTLSHPVATTVLPSDVRLWPQIFRAAERFQALPQKLLNEMIQESAGAEPLYVESVKLALPAY